MLPLVAVAIGSRPSPPHAASRLHAKIKTAASGFICLIRFSEKAQLFTCRAVPLQDRPSHGPNSPTRTQERIGSWTGSTCLGVEPKVRSLMHKTPALRMASRNVMYPWIVSIFVHTVDTVPVNEKP